MMRHSLPGPLVLIALIGLLSLPTLFAGADDEDDDDAAARDFGLFVDGRLHALSSELFGVRKPLEEPADETDFVPRAAATAEQRIKLADGLKAEFVARNMARLADMFAFWPNPQSFTHLIFCIEQWRSGTTPAGNGSLNAGSNG